MVLRSGFLLIATRLQEAADAPAHSNVRNALTQAVRDAHPGTYAYYDDHDGDGTSGNCFYGTDGESYSAPYEISSIGGKHTASIDTANRQKVMAFVVRKPVADDDDHYAAMTEALCVKAKLYTELPLYERFISKKERDAADEGSFAGKGKSFPILTPGDVQAAVHSMGRAGSDNYGPAQLKANIIRIAKAKGWTSELPKAWQDGEDKSKESARPASGDALKLIESFAWADGEELKLSESMASGVERDIRIIVPCKGSSAVYTEAALKKSAAAFKPGTQMFINHATAAEEAQRPEGDWRKLVGQLTSAAQWNESHKSGAGLYAKAKFVSSLAPEILEKASMSGVSIRANGRAATEAGRTKMQDGLPVLDEITSVESIDIVTKAGAGGVILTESARRAAEGDDNMSEDEKKRLFEAARIVEAQRAREVGIAALSDMTLLEAGKSRSIDRVIARGLPMKNGMLDTEKFTESVKAEAKAEGEYLASILGLGRVNGMGAGPAPVQLSKKELKEAKKAAKALREAETGIFADIMGDSRAGAFAAHGRMN